MKFTDGFWQMRNGVVPHYPTQVHDVKIEPEALIIYAPTKKLESRGDTLNLPLLTIRFSTPMENVIRVQMIHHKGGLPRKPKFILSPQPHPQPAITNDEQFATLRSGDLSVCIH